MLRRIRNGAGFGANGDRFGANGRAAAVDILERLDAHPAGHANLLNHAVADPDPDRGADSARRHDLAERRIRQLRWHHRDAQRLPGQLQQFGR